MPDRELFVVLGTTTVDVFLSGADRLPVPGDDEFTRESIALLADPVIVSLGGNGANSAFALAALGEPAALCSVVGRDMLGELAAGWLGERGVNLDGLVRRDVGATACTVVATDRSHHRLSLHHPGCTLDYGPADVTREVLSRASGVFLAGYHLLPRFRADGCAEILSAARRTDALTALDLGPVIDPVAGLDELSPFLADLDFVLGNVHEIAACTGIDDAEEASHALLSAGARAVVVKRGPVGAEIHTAEGSVQAPAFPVEATGTVGAGDAFNAGFLFSIRRGRPPGAALRFGNAVAALVVAARQGILASPDARTAEDLLAGNP